VILDDDFERNVEAELARTAEWSREALEAEITRLRQLLSEADKREREARAKALGDAAEAIFVMGAWSPTYEELTPNTFDEGTSAAYEVVRELQGKAEIPLQQEASHVTSQ
jgi:hypothetical protein